MNAKKKATPLRKKKAAPSARSVSGKISKRVFIHPAATVMGLVELGEDCSIWPGAVIRADMNTIRLGKAVNIQDNCTLHVDSKKGIDIGDYTLVGHQAMIHSCTIGRACLIGIGTIILDGAEIGDGCTITAGCIIRGGKKIPPMSLVVQKDGKLEIHENKSRPALTVAGSLEYIALAERFRKNVWGSFTREAEKEFYEEAVEILERLKISRQDTSR